MLKQYQEAIVAHGGIRPAARALGIAESTLRTRMKAEMARLLEQEEAEAEEKQFVFRSAALPKPIRFDPNPEAPRYFILTSAQDCTLVHEDFWNNLLRYAEWLGDCEILVSGYTYSKTLFEDHDTRSAKVGFHPLVDPFIIHGRVEIGDEIEFCGEMNTLPTAVTPLSGFSTYTRNRWGIFPHPKIQLESIATMMHDRAKQVMTTGSVTRPNYIRKKAGIKASFHHQIAAVLVELHSDGAAFCRHLIATDREDGSFYDLDRKITKKGVTTGHRAEALVYGDIHHEKIEPTVAMKTWGYDPAINYLGAGCDRFVVLADDTVPMVDLLRPRHEFFHDLSDFSARNHHNIGDHYFRYKRHVEGYHVDNVRAEMLATATFLKVVHRPETKQVIVQSNHHDAFPKWLKEADYRTDPENAVFFLECQTLIYQAMERGEDCDIYEQVLRSFGAPDATIFVSEDESYIVAGEIECAMHGHRGPDGARGSPLGISRAGMKSITGHTHSPQIRDGAYVAGVTGKLDMGYNHGPSSWLHAHVVVYPNGRRAILTFNQGRFYGEN